MPYFTRDFIKFFEELTENNNREWFNANKERYEKNIKQPFEEMVFELITRLSFEDPLLMIEPKDAIFRIYRDIRFSNDKTPYKNHVSAAINRGGRKAWNEPGIYFEMNHEGIGIYGGLYFPNNESINKIRKHLILHSKRFEKIINSKEFKTKFGGKVLGEKSKRLPKEFEKYASKQPLIFNKQFYFGSELSNTYILKEDLPDILMDYFLAGKPFNDFLREALNT
ncbi:DUF2461 domain-containing protein [Melioribacteraceae bacterium 4301-Me]|uniref:DUF2461 domain-containing protein n=1 Tax=Pyranulibacter aquaticus TaxID=3163344 RepID=UPI0035958EC9